MFEKEIQALTERTMTQLGEPGIELSLDQIEESGIHPAFLRYITAEMEFMIFRERRKLLRDAFFDYSDPEVEPYFEKIAGVIIRKKKLNYEDLKRLVYQAAAMNINYLLRPRWTINRFVFNKVEARSLEEVRLLLNYAYFYKYIRKVILSVFDIKKKKTVEHHEFRDLLNNLDRELLETQKSYILKDAIESMSSFFALAGDEEGTLRAGAVILFLKEKGMNSAVADIRKQLSDDPEAAFPVADYQAILLGDPVEELVESDEHGDEPAVIEPGEEPLMPDAAVDEPVEVLPGAEALDGLAEPPADVQEFEETIPDQQAGYEEMTDQFGDEEEAAFEPVDEPVEDTVEAPDMEEQFTASGNDPGQSDAVFNDEIDEVEAEPTVENFGEAEDEADEISEEDFEPVEVDDAEEAAAPVSVEPEGEDTMPAEEQDDLSDDEAENEEIPDDAENTVTEETEPDTTELMEEVPDQPDEELFEEVSISDEEETIPDEEDAGEEIEESFEQPDEVTGASVEEEAELFEDAAEALPVDDGIEELDLESGEEDLTELVEESAEQELVTDYDEGTDELMAEAAASTEEVVADEPVTEGTEEQSSPEPEAGGTVADADAEPEVEIASPEEAQEEMDKVVGDSEVPPSSPGEGTPANPQAIKPSGLPDINEEESFVNPDDIDPGVAQIAGETDEAIRNNKFGGWGPEDRSRDDVFSYFTPQESQKMINELFNEDHVDFVNTLENIGECANHLVALKRLTLILQAAEIKPESRSARLLIERIVSYFAEKGR